MGKSGATRAMMVVRLSLTLAAVANAPAKLNALRAIAANGDQCAMRQRRPRLTHATAVLQIDAICLGLVAWYAFQAYHFLGVYDQLSQAAASVDVVKSHVTEHAGAGNAFKAGLAPDNAAVGLLAQSALRNRLISSVVVKDGRIIVTLGKQAAGELQGKNLSFQYTPNARMYGMYTWHCSSADIAHNLLPPQCK